MKLIYALFRRNKETGEEFLARIKKAEVYFKKTFGKDPKIKFIHNKEGTEILEANLFLKEEK